MQSTASRPIRKTMLLLFAAAVLAGLLGLFAMPFASAAQPAAKARSGSPSILIFSHTTGFRHRSVEAGVSAIAELVRAKGYVPVVSEDVRMFDAGALTPYRAVIFVNNTTDPKNPESDWLVGARADSFKAWRQAGGAVVGVHGASDSHFFQPWYGKMIGGWFLRHPKGVLTAKATVVGPRHPATRNMPKTLTITDEWYVFRNFDPEVTVLLTIDPASIGEPAGAPWPISWSSEGDRDGGGGRVFYTALGHSIESYSNPVFLRHLEGGLDWALAGR